MVHVGTLPEKVVGVTLFAVGEDFSVKFWWRRYFGRT